MRKVRVNFDRILKLQSMPAYFYLLQHCKYTIFLVDHTNHWNGKLHQAQLVAVFLSGSDFS